MRMKNQDERSPQMAETDTVNLDEPGDGDSLRLTATPFSIPSLLFPLPHTGSAIQTWTQQVISSLLSRQLAQVWVAAAVSCAANSVAVENDSLTPDGRLALLLLLASGKLGSIAGLPGGLPHASVGRTNLFPPLFGEGLEGEQS
jgi:hypothetical protein